MGDWISGEVPSLYEAALGSPFWEFLEKRHPHMSLFNEAMACDSLMVDLALKNSSSVFEGLDSIVDVGGGTGTTAKIICEAFPKLKCVVFDLPQVVENLSSDSNNLSYVGGDILFKSIPEADAVLLKVLHTHIYRERTSQFVELECFRLIYAKFIWTFLLIHCESI